MNRRLSRIRKFAASVNLETNFPATEPSVMLQIAVLNHAQHFQKNFDTPTLTIVTASDERAVEPTLVVDDKSGFDLQCKIKLLQHGRQERLLISNLGSCIVLGNGNRLHQGQCETLDLPCAIFAGDSQVEISYLPTDRTGEGRRLRRIPVFGSKSSCQFPILRGDDSSPAPATLNSWFESLSQIHRSTASCTDFFKLAAHAVFNPGGLDGCLVLKRIDNDWSIVSQHLPYPEYGISYRTDLVDLAVQEQSVVYHAAADTEAFVLQHSAVVCPVLDDTGNATAIVYGFRCNNRRNNRRGIRDLEAKFVSLIADAMSAGIIRLSHEASGARRRVLLQQAFSPKVAEQLESNPDFPNVENREVSVLFADIRSFCSITERLGCHLTYHLLSDVMDRFTQIIHEHQGVVIDYYGDGISAFWNAPVEQADHAVLACRTAMAIIHSLADLNASWMNKIGSQLSVGIGVATGNAQIGNSGSKLRLKYGPQGTTVNIASRLEQATKKTGVPLIVSGETAQAVEQEFTGYRICTANFAGIHEPIELVQLVDLQTPSVGSDFFSGYQFALQYFENENYLDAVDHLLHLSEQFPDQSLVEFLLAETVARLSEEQHLEIIQKAKQHLGKNLLQPAIPSGAIAL